MSGGKKRQRGRRQTDTRGWPGVGGFSASLSEEMSSASPNRSSAAADAFAVEMKDAHQYQLLSIKLKAVLKYRCLKQGRLEGEISWLLTFLCSNVAV